MHSIVFGMSLLLGSIFLMTDSRSLQGIASQDVHESQTFKAFETEFLGVMGLKSKPRIRRNTVMPKYMLDLYNSQVEDEDFVTTNLVFKDIKTTANTIRALYHTDVRDDDITNSSKRRVTLDITAVPAHEHLVKADFRIYRNSSENKSQYIINVYQILQPGVAGEKSVKRLLDSRVVKARSYAGWENLDIMKAVHDWRELPSRNHGLEVDIMSENGHPIDISHLRFDKPVAVEDAERMWSDQRPLLALYTRDPKTHYHKERVRRSLQLNRPRRPGLCKRYELIVDFKKLNWDSWLIAPDQYNAYFCQGECVYPLAEHMNTTNHAIVQTVVHSVKEFRDTVPSACCIPTSFDSLRILYYDENKTPVIKKYKKMVVTGCGCR